MTQTLLAIDQGTSSTRAIVFAPDGHIVAEAQLEHGQSNTVTDQDEAMGCVEQDGEEIWRNTIAVCQQVLAQVNINEVLAIGITNQRETLVTWHADSGELLAPVIVWQDRRSAQLCQQWLQRGLESWFQEKTGLLIDPYFSATKIAWLLESRADLRELFQQKKLRFGTIDTFLLWCLTGGKSYATDVTNASRTLLMNLQTQHWDKDLLAFFKIDTHCLPEIKDCTADFGVTMPGLFSKSLPICAMIGDQQAALVGQACFDKGMAKSTYGTGCFLLVNTGDKPVYSKNRLLTTIAYRVKGQLAYGLEGSIFVAGACMQWLRDTLKLIHDAGESETFAKQIEDTEGVYLVPAFTGLGAPYWDPWARGAIVGLTRTTGIAHIIRAALEAVGYQTADLLRLMRLEGAAMTQLRVDGGMTVNGWLLQFLADILNCSIERPKVIETTALGAAYLAGLQIGVYESFAEIASLWHADTVYHSKMNDAKRDKLYQGWQQAVKKVLTQKVV